MRPKRQLLGESSDSIVCLLQREVLLDGASAIYGGTAVGGVVNVILKRSYTGGQVSTTYQNTFDTDAPIRTVSGIYGFSLGSRTHVTISGSYTDGTPLRMKDRPLRGGICWFAGQNLGRARLVALSGGTPEEVQRSSDVQKAYLGQDQ